MNSFKKLFTFLLISSSLFAQVNDNSVIINGKTFVETIPAHEIQERINILGKQITQDYQGKTPLIIVVLNGAFIFASDLVRSIALDCDIDFIKISSYGNSTRSSGLVKLQKDVTISPTNRDVIIVEDIVDSGLSISYVRDMISKHNPSSIAIASFLFKPDNAKINFPIDYVGFNINPDFIIGYGIDYAQKGRNLPNICTLVNS